MVEPVFFFRVARRHTPNTPFIEWVADDHPATGLLELVRVQPTTSLPTLWTWLETFDLAYTLLHQVGHPRRVQHINGDLTYEHLCLRSHTGEELLICGQPSTELDTADRAVLGTIVLFVGGGLGGSSEELQELLDEEAAERAEPRPARPQTPTDLGDFAATKALVEGLITTVASTTATVKLSPLRRDEPADLVIGDATFRVYDKTSHMLAGLFAQVAQHIQVGVRRIQTAATGAQVRS